jgi:antitoxin CcdA
MEALVSGGDSIMMHTTIPGAARKPTNVTLDEALLVEAKALRINISQAAEAGLARAVAERRAAQWLEENRGALDSSNAYVEQHGLPLAQFRNF